MRPFFLDSQSPTGGRRFCVYETPARPASGAVVYLHPFAEEMNKSRRMAALQRRALVDAGFAVLAIDLLGCGDSSGDFGDATWDEWLADASLAIDWMRAQHDAPLWLWGLRAGCLLACEVAGRCVEQPHLLFWQPPTAGKVLLQQFTRLRLASGLSEGRSVTAKDDVKAELAAGRPVEIAGYALSPALATGLERARLSPPARTCHAAWVEISTREERTLLPATATAAAAWRDAGHHLVNEVVGGPPFWQTQEIEDAPALVSASVRLMRSLRSREVPA